MSMAVVPRGAGAPQPKMARGDDFITVVTNADGAKRVTVSCKGARFEADAADARAAALEVANFFLNVFLEQADDEDLDVYYKIMVSYANKSRSAAEFGARRPKKHKKKVLDPMARQLRDVMVKITGDTDRSVLKDAMIKLRRQLFGDAQKYTSEALELIEGLEPDKERGRELKQNWEKARDACALALYHVENDKTNLVKLSKLTLAKASAEAAANSAQPGVEERQKYERLTKRIIDKYNDVEIQKRIEIVAQVQPLQCKLVLTSKDNASISELLKKADGTDFEDSFTNLEEEYGGKGVNDLLRAAATILVRAEMNSAPNEYVEKMGEACDKLQTAIGYCGGDYQAAMRQRWLFGKANAIKMIFFGLFIINQLGFNPPRGPLDAIWQAGGGEKVEQVPEVPEVPWYEIGPKKDVGGILIPEKYIGFIDTAIKRFSSGI